ncbi:eCIS core domain-containing protein [Streptomyces europaeiscabiei]|uniref:eCIS core domain-containing protein n=1 Tax=Streptomyces europaeiscabiei TaxID=146819 RepID=UPI0038D4B700
MRAQDQRSGKARTTDSARRTGQPPGPAATLLALQRLAGNAAVARAVEQQRHTHDAHCGHNPAVQRSAVHEVLRSAGRPLDTPLRKEMEARLGAGFGDVQVHNDTVAQRSAAEIGARAYTSGNHVVIGAGGADKHTLAHELTHVIQQRRGPVSGTDTGDGTRLSDPSDRFEREAEATAARVMSGPPRGAAVDAPADGGGQTSGQPAVQRVLTLGEKVKESASEQDAETTYSKILLGVRNTPLAGAWEDRENRPAIIQVLKEWMDAPKQSNPPANGTSRPQDAKDALWRHYKTDEEAASAVLHRVRALPVADVEKQISESVALDEKIREKLAEFIGTHLSPWLAERRKESEELAGHLDFTTAQLAALGRLYLPFVDFGEKTLAGILADPQPEKFATLISAIHDVAEILYKIEGMEDHVTVTQEEFKGYVLKGDENPSAERNLPGWTLDGVGPGTGPELDRQPVDQTFRGDKATPNQRNAQVNTAGRLGFPVSLGPSRTTGKLMKLAHVTGADPQMKESIAYALMALWYTDYRRDLTDIHRYHFVMDMAANFGVTYNPYRAPRNPVTGTNYTDLIRQTLDRYRTNQETKAAEYWKNDGERAFKGLDQAGPSSASAVNTLPQAAEQTAARPQWVQNPQALAIMAKLHVPIRIAFNQESGNADLAARLELTTAELEAGMAVLTAKNPKPLVQINGQGLVLTSLGKTQARKHFGKP